MFQRLDNGVTVKLVGFSRAKEIGESTILSAPVMQETRFSLYMSPEHVQGKAIDSRADIYGLGCTMYQALTGEIPLKGPTVYQTIHRHLHETPPSIRAARSDRGYPQELELVVAKAMQKNPADRFQSASEMAASLQSIRI
jgi:serine/threonine-protein kinase